MEKLNQLRNLLRPTSTLLAGAGGEPCRGLATFLREPRRRFSTESEQREDATVDNFFETPDTGAAYRKLLGITKQTLKSDVINLLDECKLSLDDIRVNYDRSFAPIGMLVQFRSRHEIDRAFKLINRKGRLHKLERVDRSQWEFTTNYDGKTLLLQGLPRQAIPEDIERFLSGCQYDPSSIQLFYRQGFPDPIRMATVSFPSRAQAMNAFIAKNRGFCLNNQISVRVLQ
ncbi:uncharacterized protein LOC116206696 [Punica granatum]|uniref:Uncharacterized protein LOC116206696 n=1 Tax=Punica granatum TaxID=22663 RepID=A0A6P8DFH6_PUNGR|nr:uncharacterized protein LOC116206696 [Punica granatum]